MTISVTRSRTQSLNFESRTCSRSVNIISGTTLSLSPASACDGLHQRRDLYRGKIAKGVGYRIRQDDLVAMPHGAAGIDDVGHITFAFGWFGTNQRFTRTREDLCGILLVQENCPDRIFPYRT